MLNKSSIFNYLTLILAIFTICIAIWTIVTKASGLICFIFLVLMIISNTISRKINEDSSKLTKEDEELLKSLKNKSEEK